MFKEGSIVNGAETDIDMDVEYVKVEATNPNSTGTADVATYLSGFTGKLIQGETTGVVAEIVKTVASTGTDLATIIVRYLQHGTDETATTNPSERFSPSEEISEVNVSAAGAITTASNNNEFKVAALGLSPVGRSSIASINEGVVFLRGYFVKVDAQTIVLEKYNGKPSYRIGLDIVEELVGSGTDTTLLDNSQGTTNENAAGADRLKFTLTLAKFALTATTDTNFVELGRVSNGVIELEVKRPVYNHIENTLAQRTFDANGDFVIRQFTHSFREHLLDGFNRGFYEAYQGGDESQFVMQVSPGKAYVKGYSIDKTGTTNLTLNKARTTEALTNANTPARLGNKLRIKDSHGQPEFGDSTNTESYKAIQLFDKATATPGTLNAYAGTGSTTTVGHIGFARVRNIDEHSTAFENLYLFDIKMFTMLSTTVATNNFKVGDKVTGSASGAVGIVAYADTTNNHIMVHDVVGTFKTTDTLSLKGQGTCGTIIVNAGSFVSTTPYIITELGNTTQAQWNTAAGTSGQTYAVGSTFTAAAAGTGTGKVKVDFSITAVRSFQVEDARSVGQTKSSETTGTQNFTANIALDNDKVISGLTTITSTALTGVGTDFLTELRKGDIVLDGNGAEQLIASVTDNSNATLVAAGTNIKQVGLLRRRAKLYNQDQSATVFAFPRDHVSKSTPTEITVKYQKEFEVGTSGEITLTKEANESFEPKNNDNYQFAIVKEATGSPTRANGVVLGGDDVSSVNTSSGEVVLGAAADDGAIVRATYTVSVTNPTSKSKNLESFVH
jgi:hypothetical protein